MSSTTTRRMINRKLNERHDGTLDRTLRQQLLKTLTLLLVSMLGQFTFATDVDLYRGLLFWIKDQTNIEGNETRKTTYALSKAFDGSFSNSLAGAALPAKGSISFSLAFSFKVGNQDCINRILRIGAYRHFYVGADNRLRSVIPVGSGTMYKEVRSSLVVRENTWYSVVLRQEDDRHVYLFAGEEGAELGCVADYEDSKIFEIDSTNVSVGTITLGSCNYPSVGNLQSGQFANIRFWTRALTNHECVMVDVCRDVILETKQLGCPSDAKYDFFPLGGNLFGVDESCITPKNASRYNVSGYGWCEEAGRLSSTGYAMSSDGGGRIVYKDFSELFGTTVFNGWSTEVHYERGSYGMERKITISRPDEPSLSSGSTTNASYVFWLRVDKFPDSVDHVIFSRNIRGSLVSKFPDDEEVCLKVNPEGKLVLRQNGVDTVLGGACLRIGEWALISVIGHAKGSITIFVNKVKAGSVSSPITLGALCGIDTRWKRTSYWRVATTGQYSIYDESSSGAGGEAIQPITDMTIGGWNGAIDEIAFYGKALSVDEVVGIYEAACLPDPYTSINPTTRNFSTSGGGGAIITSGSSEAWHARVSEPWITLSANNGNIGYPVAYVISATTNAEQRIGSVYINGHVHTVTQDGVGGTIGSNSAIFEYEGGNDTIAVEVQNGIAWKATSSVGWLSVSQRDGVGPGSVLCQVLPYDEVATRQGTLTIAGNTFTVFQYGRRMKLESAVATRDYEAHTIPITVNALDTTQWSVTTNSAWISIVDGGNGKGGDLVTIAIMENPSYKARTGTVTIGTETFMVTQQGRPAAELSFSVNPVSTTASVNGANGMVSVMATPDLPWVSTSGANWITIYPATANGAGNGNIVYTASPNPTLFERTGVVTVTPEAASGMTAKTHTVTQPAAQASLSLGGYEFVAAGEPCSVEVSCADIVQWSVEETLDWLTVNGSTSRTGPGTVVLQATANNTVYPRSGTVTIAGKTFSVSQMARGVEVEYDSMLFGTDGGYESISIHPDGNSAWTAVASDPTWITIFQGDSGTGDGEILYIVAPYVGDGAARTGWIEVGDKKVYITQRAYELSISPNGSVVKGNNGAGEFGVSANIGAVWNAVVTEPWIALVSGYDAGTGSGIVRFICEDNNTGRPRVGKIIVAGEEYTVTQSARILVQIQATAGRGGSIKGAGTYDKGEKIVLTAVPDSGYQFVRWTGPVSSTANPLTMEADDLTGIKAEFAPMPVDFTSVVSSLDGVDLAWNTLAWATTYRLFRGETDDIASATELATFQNGAVDAYRDESGERGVMYWYWVTASGDVDDAVSMPASGMRMPIVNSSITYQNLRGATHSNPSTYVEGRTVVFSHPSAITGYTFAGWTPERITEDMTGAQKVRAAWTAHKYSITYNANGGSGSTSATSATYDREAKVAANGFTRAGYSFIGWATNATGTVAYAPGQPVTNLTDAADAQLTFYAVWAVNQYAVTFNANGGTGGKTVTQDYGTSLAAPTVTRTGYTFAGWSPAVPATMPAANATYVAQWTKNKYTVTFNANGGAGGWSKSMDFGASITAPTVSRVGYAFTGWTPAVAATVHVGGAAYTAQWKVNQYAVTFDANGGTGGKTVTQNYGTALAAPTVTRAGYTFAGWSPAVPSTMPAGNIAYVAQWTKNKYTVTFNANGGTGGWSRSMDYGAAIAAPAVTRTGYTFAGWSPAVARTVPIGGASYTAQWTINRHKVTLSLNGGEGVGSVTVNYGTKVGDLPVPFREGYEFLGWFTAATGGRRIVDNVLVTGDMMLYAQWHILMPELYETIDGAAPETAASEYNGCLVDDDGNMKGTIQVKVGKPNKKTGLATVKATVQLGAKKVTLKAEGKGGVQIAADGPTSIGLVGGEPCTVVLGSDGVYGFYGNYEIDGARNFFTSKNKGEQNAANALLGKWLGGVSILADVGNFTVTISAKGKAKVSGTLANGKKATGNAVFLVGEEWACVPVVLPKANISFALWLPLDGGEVVVNGLGDDVVAGRGGALKAGVAFRIDEDEFAAVTGIAALPYLPDGVSVEPKGTKWAVAGGAKAGKVAYRRGTQEIDEAKLGDNPSGLKLTYKAKDGSFKGSFKAYAEVKGKLKATTVSVSGIVLNGVGYGTATVKGKGSVPVTIE